MEVLEKNKINYKFFPKFRGKNKNVRDKKAAKTRIDIPAPISIILQYYRGNKLIAQSITGQDTSHSNTICSFVIKCLKVFFTTVMGGVNFVVEQAVKELEARFMKNKTETHFRWV